MVEEALDLFMEHTLKSHDWLHTELSSRSETDTKQGRGQRNNARGAAHSEPYRTGRGA